MNIAICDDDVLFLDATSKLIKQYQLNNSDQILDIEKYNHPLDLLKAINRGAIFDIFILDILMPEYNGIELAKEIRLNNRHAKIIFATITPEYAVNSYEVSAFYYLLKPIDPVLFFKLLDEIDFELRRDIKMNISISNFGNVINVPIISILYIEVLKHKIYYHMVDNKVHNTYGSLKEIAAKLGSFEMFHQCHKSYLVNYEHVTMVIDHNFKMRNNALVPISRQFYRTTKQKYLQFVAHHD